jgi:hypothetical protein
MPQGAVILPFYIFHECHPLIVALAPKELENREK